MRPEGSLRNAINELAEEAGAYVIVSSADSCSATSLLARLDAMREAIADAPRAAGLSMQFYDQNKVASWVRSHAGLIPWVRERIGRSAHGWHSYGNWAKAPAAVAAYLPDELPRVETPFSRLSGNLSLFDGIQFVRSRLKCAGKAVRLVGLSGTGKTRFAQALFEEQTGEQSLDAWTAIYADTADNPEPGPVALTADLIAEGSRAVLVVDNCSPELHHSLSELCRRDESTMSLLTIEYDIRDDTPEGTEVVELHPASEGLVRECLRRRFDNISPVDIGTIAEFAGGNPRIAIALAEAVERDGTISGLDNEQLFRRLFHQRRDPSESLLRAAQVCSLVYSFHGEDTQPPHAELSVLAALVAQTPLQLYAHIAELKRRGLVQRRGPWRAVLPHAIANRLAAIAFENIPPSVIETSFRAECRERVLRSFSRRLGFLTASEEAAAIARDWLSPSGILGDAAALSELGRTLLHNVAPLAPGAAIATLERGLASLDHDQMAIVGCHYRKLLRSLAWEAIHFRRCAHMLLRIASASPTSSGANDAAKTFASLFTIHGSGTHASINQRLEMLHPLLHSSHDNELSLGVLGLDAALQTTEFWTDHRFEFGGRTRDYGYKPRTEEDVAGWFSAVLAKVSEVVCNAAPSASGVRAAFARRFAGLWSIESLHGDLEDISVRLNSVEFWDEGWLAVRDALSWKLEDDGETASATRLRALELLLRPQSLIDRVKAVVVEHQNEFQGEIAGYALFDVNGWDQGALVARALGRETAVHPQETSSIIESALRGGGGHSFDFGQGIAEGAPDPSRTWQDMVRVSQLIESDRRDVRVLCGFLHTLEQSQPTLVTCLLDNAVTNETLSPNFPQLQAAVPLNERAMSRIMDL